MKRKMGLYRARAALIAALLSWLWAAPLTAADRTEAAAGEPLPAFVTIPPHAWLLEQLGGPRVRVQVLLQPGDSPHAYEPSPRQVAALGRARVFFRIGEAFEERLLERITRMFRELRVVDLRQGLPLRKIEGGEHAGHADHGHGRADPHLWLDPQLFSRQAAIMAQALIELDPVHAAQYRANLAALQARLDSLDQRIAALLAPYRGGTVFVYHPAFGYFTDRYGLEQVAVEVEGKEPAARELAALIARLRKERAKVLFVQPQFAGSASRALESALDLRVERLDPLARDYPVNLLEIARQLAAALAAQATATRMGG